MSEVKKEVSAVEWLIEQLTPSISLQQKHIDELKEQANKMFEKQIENAFNAGFDDGCGFIEDMKYKEAEQYYNETYGKKNKQ
jgi:hypothetical protein